MGFRSLGEDGVARSNSECRSTNRSGIHDSTREFLSSLIRGSTVLRVGDKSYGRVAFPSSLPSSHSEASCRSRESVIVWQVEIYSQSEQGEVSFGGGAIIL